MGKHQCKSKRNLIGMASNLRAMASNLEAMGKHQYKSIQIILWALPMWDIFLAAEMRSCLGEGQGGQHFSSAKPL